MLSQEQSNIATIRWNGAEYRTWIEMVTPERAQKILDSNGDRNRRRRHGRVQRYAADMRTGKWRITGETVRLDENGMLLNGQHRLAAVVLSGATVPMWFASGISTSTMIVQDSGLPVSSDDWMPLEHAAAATKLVRSVLRAFAPGMASQGSRDEIVTAHNILGAEHVKWAIESSKSRFAQRAPVRAVAVLIRRVDPERAEVFMRRLSENDLPAGTPENKLHFALTERGKLHPDEEIGLAVRVAVGILRDHDKGLTKIYEAGTASVAWLLKATKLEKLTTLRRDSNAEVSS